MPKMQFDKQSKLFAHRKMGAYFRYQEEAEKIKALWFADLLALEAQVKEKWGEMHNAALIKNKLATSKGALRDQVVQLLQILDDEYQRELLRIVSTLGGRVEGKRVSFPDGSEANMPQHLTIKDDDLRALL